MNWTEGNLARRSRGRKGKEVLLRQKEYFAKARAGLANPHSQMSPSSISLFARSPRLTSSSRHRNTSRTRSNASSSSTSKTCARGAGKLQVSKYFQGAASKLSSLSSSQQAQDEDKSLRTKRRKLLLKGDWVGTDFLKPIEMDLPQPQTSSRNPWGGPKGTSHPAGDRIRHLLGITSIDNNLQDHENPGNNLYPVLRSQLKVRVGSMEKDLDESSSAIFSSKSHRNSVSNMKASHRIDSESQLHAPARREDVLDASSVTCSESRSYSRSEGSCSGPILTTSPLLYHPLPHRPPALRLLSSHSSDSDNASSTKARIGMLQPEISFAEAEQNAAWKELMFGTGNAAWDAVDGFANKESAREVSPGVSHLGLYKESRQLSEHEEDILLSRFELDQDDKDLVHCRSPVQRLDHTADDGRQYTTYFKHGGRDLGPLVAVKEFTGFEGTGSSQPDHGLAVGHGNNSETSSSSSHERGRFSDRPSERLGGEADDTNHDHTTLSAQKSRAVKLLSALTNLQAPVPDKPVNVPTRTHDRLDRNYWFMSNLPKVVLQADKRAENGVSQSCPIKANQTSIPQPVSFESENEMWRQFLFGECGDKMEEMLEEARKITARKICPSDQACSTTNDSTNGQPQLSVSVAKNKHGLGHDLGSDEHAQKPQFDTSVADSARRQAALRTSLPNTFSSVDLPTEINTDQGFSSSSSEVVSRITDEALGHSDAWSIIATADPDDAPAAVVLSRPSKAGDCNEGFRFSRPKLFLGKKTSHFDEERQLALSEPQIRGQTLRRRRQKRNGDGRACIRKLPNFTMDPIEEIEEMQVRQTEKPSLFGSLDTEDQS
ncbi:hypothetical protein BD289DRAFT_198804 [Coniella lustricola]|uniref:Uncharacterized protein n=1 Tax=Coniella lustricola TaxID=2025994 RepID=A0A2T3ACM9_9PEZI|nr:hypothetical protein BD289DRAFT_198804 [Coniella lustricola]